MTGSPGTSGPATLHVVVRRTPGQEPERPAPERVLEQRAASRRALQEAARQAGCEDETFEKCPDRGHPVPTVHGWHWSISHDASWVAAVVSRGGPLGVDLERVALRRRLLVERVADREEREALGETDDEPLDANGFARLWTSKEAVLKREQIGLPGLKRCRLELVDGPALTRMSYDGMAREVVHTRIEDHLVSLCTPGLFVRVVWDVGPMGAKEANPAR